jgi:ribosomal protein S18 acetylase RimI-like enzyme
VGQAGQVRTTELRTATAADAQPILDLHLLVDLAQIGEPGTTIDEVRTEVTGEQAAGAVIDAADGDGIVGHAWVDHRSGSAKARGDLAVRPGSDPRLITLLLGWLRIKAAELAPGLPLHVFADSNDAVKISAYAAADGELVRRYYRMGIDLTAGALTDSLPLAADVDIRTVRDEDADLRAVHAVIDTSFMDHYGHEPHTYPAWVEHARGQCADLSLWWLATVNGEPAASLYGCQVGDAGYVDTLGTLRAHRGKGLARSLLLTAFAEFRRRGMGKGVLGVDATNPTGALELYESVGMAAEHENWRYELPPLSAM